MVLSQKHCFRPCLIFLRNVHSGVDTNHYKTLGLSPAASRSEIKAAYYELSKKHHPDRNKGSEASARIFREVREAYEVLGNDKKRMQYDKDRIFKVVREPRKVHYPDNNPDYKDEAERVHYQSRARPIIRKYTYGKTTYYDFDEWYDNHYGKKSNFTFRQPKQFTYGYSKEIEKEIQIYDKVKIIFTFLLYFMVFLTTISVLSSNKKRTVK